MKKIDFFNSAVFYKDHKKFEFNGRHYEREKLREHLNGLDESVRNYSSARDNETLVTKRIQQHVDANALRISTNEDLESKDFMLNPLGAIIKKQKVNLLIHWAYNDAYKKPSFKLSQLDREFHDFSRLGPCDSLDKIDLAGAYGKDANIFILTKFSYLTNPEAYSL